MTTPRRRTCSRYAYSRYATRCSPTAVFPVPGAPCTQTVCAASARTMSSWSGWMVATMSRMGPDRGRSISSIRIRLGRGRGWLPNGRVTPGIRPGAEELVLVGGQLAAGEPEAPAQRQVHRVGRAGPVERPRHRRPPVDDRGRAVRRVHVPAADVEAVPGDAVVGYVRIREFRSGVSGPDVRLRIVRRSRGGRRRAGYRGCPSGLRPGGTASALRYSSETGSPPIARSDSTSSRISRRNSRERRNWSRSAVRTGSPPDRSAC